MLSESANSKEKHEKFIFFIGVTRIRFLSVNSKVNLRVGGLSAVFPVPLTFISCFKSMKKPIKLLTSHSILRMKGLFSYLEVRLKPVDV